MNAATAALVERRGTPAPVREPSDRVLRVAQVLTNFTTGSGGITLRGALALDRARFVNVIVAPEGGSLIPRAEEAGLEVVQLHHFATARRIYPWADLHALRELAEHLSRGKFDLVHTHGARAGAIGRVAAHRAGVPAIVHTLHGFPFNEFQSRPTRTAIRAIERRLGRITDYFVTDGTFVASEAIRLKIAHPERVRGVVSSIDGIPQVNETLRNRARHMLGIPAEAKLIGTAARLARQKAPLDMIKAVAGLGRSDVYVAWIGDGDMRPQAENLIRKVGLEGRFLLLGDRDDVPTLLPGFDLFAMSSLWEGLPCSVVEAMTCGIPVVSTAVNSVPEIVISGRTGLLARPGDPASLRRALAYMLDHPDEAARMALAAGTQIREQFRADLVGEELTEIYDTALRLAATSPLRSPA